MFHDPLARESARSRSPEPSRRLDAGTSNPRNTGCQHRGLSVHLVRIYAVWSSRLMKTHQPPLLGRTNKKFKSTIHRVTNMSGEERYSIPFFFGVDYDATVSVLEKHSSTMHPPCRAPFQAGEVRRTPCGCLCTIINRR